MKIGEPNPRPHGVLRFGPFELEPETGELRNSGIPVKLRHQPSRVLALLASHPGRLVTREEMVGLIWGSATHVDYQQGLNYCIRDIRTALGDSAEAPRFVETLPRRGYRFIAPVESRADSPAPPLGAGPAPARRAWRLRAAAAAGCLALGLGALGLWTALLGHRASAPAGRLGIAVLPFEELSGDASLANFAEGLTEELIAHLGRTHPARLAVIARTTARGFGTGARPIEALGRELGVHYALEGSVRRASERLRVTARLVRVADRRQIWSETFDAEPGDVLILQGRLARAAASGVHLTLDPGEPSRPANPLRMDPEAYRLYALGRALWNTWTVAGLRRSLECFDEAIRIVPDYAQAHAALADAYIALAEQSPEPPEEHLRRAKQAALRALELDGSLAEAHAALGMVVGTHEFDWLAGENGLKRAVALNPGYATARHWYSHLLRAIGRSDEALAQIRVAEELAPFSAIIRHNVALLRMQRGELPQALERFRSLIAGEPGFPPAYMGLGRTLLLQGDSNGALRAIERAVQLSGSNPRYEAALAHAYAAAGKPRDARRILERLEREPAVRVYDLAIARAGLADYDRAFVSLQRAVQAKDPAARNVLVDERLRPLQRDPRWAALTQGLGLTAHPTRAEFFR